MEKVVLGLSGGVDSALCARLLLEQGHEVVGVYLETGSEMCIRDRPPGNHPDPLYFV